MKFPSQKMKQLSTALVLPWLVGLMVVLYAQVVVAQSGVASGDAVVAVGPDTGWKTYRYDNRRSGVIRDQSFGSLTVRAVETRDQGRCVIHPHIKFKKWTQQQLAILHCADSIIIRLPKLQVI